MGRAVLLEELDRALEVDAALVGAAADPGHHPGMLEQVGLLERIRRERRRLLVVALRLEGRGERRRPLAGLAQCRDRPAGDVVCVGRVRVGPVGRQVVAGDDLGQLVLALDPCAAAAARCFARRSCLESIS